MLDAPSVNVITLNESIETIEYLKGNGYVPSDAMDPKIVGPSVTLFMNHPGGKLSAEWARGHGEVRQSEADAQDCVVSLQACMSELPAAFDPGDKRVTDALDKGFADFASALEKADAAPKQIRGRLVTEVQETTSKAYLEVQNAFVSFYDATLLQIATIVHDVATPESSP